MQEPLISVIIPVYNAGKYLEQCLTSIIEQSYKNLQIICIDDGSSDNSFNILASFAKSDSRITLLQQQNFGASVARNQGVEFSSGDYISYVDADDFIMNGLYETFVEYINACTVPIDMFMFNASFYRQEQKNTSQNKIFSISEWKNHTNNLSIHTYKDCEDFMMHNVGVWNKIFRKEFIIQNQIYFPNFLKYEDFYYYIISILQAKAILVTDEIFYQYRDLRNLGSASTENSERVFHIFEIINLIYNKIKNLGLYESLKYNLFRFEYENYLYYYNLCPEPLREKFYTQVKLRLLDSYNKLDKNIANKLKNYEIFDLICNHPKHYFDSFVQYYKYKFL